MMITAGESGRGDEVGHVVVDVADGCAAAEQRQGLGCRICHLVDGDGDGGLPERLSGRLMRLGCGCRGELAAAHRRCAEAWFSVRGNKCCEICGENAVNITGGSGKEFIRQWRHDTAGIDGGCSSKACSFSKSQSFCNLLIVLLIVAFVLPWFFHNHMI